MNILFILAAALLLCTAYVVFEIARSKPWPRKRNEKDIWR